MNSKFIIIFNPDFYHLKGENFKAVNIEFFSDGNGYDDNDRTEIKQLTLTGRLYLDNGNQSVLRLK